MSKDTLVAESLRGAAGLNSELKMSEGKLHGRAHHDMGNAMYASFMAEKNIR